METVQLQCGHCKQVIAIGVEHLGGQVQCPHCKGVLQTPPRSSQPESAPTIAPIPNMELNQTESIFAGPESSDQLLGEPESPKVEMPTAAMEARSAAVETAPSEPDADLSKFKRRPVFDRSVLALYGFIFLIPYAVLTTLAVLYLVFMQAPRPHPFDMMPDPVPDKKGGGARKAGLIIKHDYALADHQRVALGKSIQVGKDGDLEVTAERVRLTEEGDLKLYLRAKNLSKTTAFVPMSGGFLIPVKGAEPPYTYLETHSKKIEKLFNPTLEYRRGLKDSDDQAKDDLLGPHEETMLVLTTSSLDRTPHIEAIAKSNDSFTWRVQLRRGLVKWKDKDVSATAVIGVDFTSDQIVRN